MNNEDIKKKELEYKIKNLSSDTIQFIINEIDVLIEKNNEHSFSINDSNELFKNRGKILSLKDLKSRLISYENYKDNM